MGPRRELQKGDQWSPSRRGKNGYWLFLMPRVGNLTDAGQKCINLSLALAQIHQAGSTAGFFFILEILHPAYSTMGTLLSETWREARRRLSER